MNRLLTNLAEQGCDMEDAKKRLLEDEDFLEQCIRMTALDPAFSELEQAIAAHASTEAFYAVHSLKGVFGNIGLTPLYLLATQIVEPLRNGELTPDVEVLCETLLTQQQQLLSLIEEYDQSNAES